MLSITEPSGIPLAQQPFHDAGPLCVPTPPTALGDRVEVRLWVPASFPVASVSRARRAGGGRAPSSRRTP